MIVLHRLSHPEHPLHLNPDLIQTVEANPDTVVSLVNASKLVVRETPEHVTELVLEWKAEILARALTARPADAEPQPRLAEVLPLVQEPDARV